MRKPWILFALIIGSIGSYSQEQKPTRQEEIFLNGGMKFPSVEVRNIFSGEKFDLSALNKSHLKYSDKPTVVISWSDIYCGPCINRINDMLKDGMDREYNIITINVDEQSSRSDEALQRKISGRSNWDRITHLRMDYKKYEEAFNATSVPHWFVLDKERKIVNAYLTYSVTVKELKEELKVLSGNLNFNSRVYLNGNFVNDEAVPDHYFLASKETAEFYVQIDQDNDKRHLKYFYAANEEPHRVIPFKKISGEWKYDGMYLEYNSDGLVVGASEFKNGMLHGVVKRWNQSGRVLWEVNFVNGKKDGLARDYIEGTTVRETIFKDGKQVSTKLFTDNIASLKKSLMESVNMEIISTPYGIIKEGIALVEGSGLEKTVDLVKWEDLKDCKVDIDGFYYRGEPLHYTRVAEKSSENISFAGDIFYLDDEENTRNFSVVFKRDKKQYERVVEMILNLKTLFLMK